MIKTTFLALFTVSVLLTGTIAGSALVQNAEALKSQGTGLPEVGSKKVCGDRLCSEIPPEEKPKEEKTREQVKQEKKSKEAEKAKDTPKKDTKAETMDAAKAAPSKTPKTVTGTITSVQDPGQGHEAHQLAIILPPNENVYRGHLTYTASENVQLVALHGPLKAGMDKGQAIWTVDGKTKYGLTFVDRENSAGVWQFSGNAVAIHTKNTEPFTVTYSVTYTEHVKDGEKIIRGTTISKMDSSPGHEDHQTIILLGPRDQPFRGHLSYTASEPIQIVSLIGPFTKGDLIGLPSWTPDGKTFYAFASIPTKASGSTSFSGNGLLLHTQNSEPFTASYSIVLTK